MYPILDLGLVRPYLQTHIYLLKKLGTDCTKTFCADLVLRFSNRRRIEAKIENAEKVSRVSTASGNQGNQGKLEGTFPVREKSGNLAFF